jgi:hypothetical protein
MTEVA